MIVQFFLIHAEKPGIKKRSLMLDGTFIIIIIIMLPCFEVNSNWVKVEAGFVSIASEQTKTTCPGWIIMDLFKILAITLCLVGRTKNGLERREVLARL